ncbi:MAG: hypothetical protein Q9217_003111 [Psora testacea]
MNLSILHSLPAFLALTLALSQPDQLPHIREPLTAPHARIPVFARGNTNNRMKSAAETPPIDKRFTFNELYQLQKKFLDAFIYPANQVQAESINSTLFSTDVQGRVDITRTFIGRELNTEYIFGLFANLAANQKAFTLLGFATSYEIVHFAASQNIASASTRYGDAPVPIVIDTWNVFNAAGEISMYDATFKWWQWTVDYLIGAAGKALNKTTEQTAAFAQKALAESICGTAIKYCNGTNVQYNSTQTCLQFLTKEVRLGEAYELGRNTLLCRMVHQNMVVFRPSTHCSHIGPSGGGYCNDDKSYVGTVTENYYSNYPFAYLDNGAS